MPAEALQPSMPLSGPAGPVPLVELENLTKHFRVAGGGLRGGGEVVHAVDDVNLSIYEGETLGLVGESGCGKSTLGRTLLRLVEPTSGDIRFRGESIVSLKRPQMRKLRGEIAMIFQDPFSSLDPRQTVGDIIGEALTIQTDLSRRARGDRVSELLDMVGLSPGHADRYPHEFSGGQRQRVGIARALSVEPSFIVCDEPISALDVSIQAQIMNLLMRLQDELKLTYLFIAHDLSAVKHISDRIAVMYLGKVVEVASPEEIHARPRHPYTRSLIAAIPDPDPRIERARKRELLIGEIPSPTNPPSGCRFRTRCPIAQARCAEEVPELITLPGSDARAACLFPLAYDAVEVAR
jgi:oligopeptide transport system ATP-binding protein